MSIELVLSEVLLSSHSGGSDQSLDLGGFVVGLLALGGGNSADNGAGDCLVVALWVLLEGFSVNGKESANLSGSLGAESLGDFGVG